MSGERIADFLRSGHVAAVAAAAGAAYYLGARLGLELRIPPATPSVLWPPNAILTAFLLIVPPSRWWSVLVGAAIVHFAVELQVWAPMMVAALFVTNSIEAIIAAGGIRYFSDQPSRLDTFRRISIFVAVAGIAAPFVSSFLDAAAVSYWHGEDYWTVFRFRFPSNMLAQLAIVPVLVGAVTYRPRERLTPRRHWFKILATALGLIVVAVVVAQFGDRIGFSRAPMALFLPFLLWAAVRFGAAGVGFSVLALVFLALQRQLYGGAFFEGVPPESQVGVLRMFLVAATVPLLCVGALVKERERAVQALEESHLLKSSILASIPSLVAVVGSDGRVLTVNENWRDVMQRRRGRSEVPIAPGVSFEELLNATVESNSAAVQSASDGVQHVLGGVVPRFALDYSNGNRTGEERWWTMSVVPLEGSGGGAVVTHTDITVRRQAEIDAQKSRDELAHVTRVWVMGELTASLSHQLNQPLTAISGNAQAGRRFLNARPPNLEEVDHILADIVSDAQRAADVTRAVRDMLRKDVSEHEQLDLNDVIRDTASLVTSEAVVRNVSLKLELAPALPLIRGEAVQLRQVLLNLLMNALEAASAEGAASVRRVIVSSEARDGGHVTILVRDTGGGLADETEPHIFEPLFTTKTTGMGMGLPIARAIVEAHGGIIKAGNAPGGGAVFSLILPLSLDERELPAPALH